MPNNATTRPNRPARAGLVAIAAFGLAWTLPSAQASEPAQALTTVPDRVESLLAKMTLEEKLGQLTQVWGGEAKDVNPGITQKNFDDLAGAARVGQVGSFLGACGADYTNRLQRAAVEESRLGIPLIIGNDVIHGFRTIFPIPLAEACSWDPAIVQRAARVAAIEASAAGTHWTFAPMVDVCRDPRWGRIAEGAGEDPFLGAALAAARVRGFQGDDLAAPDTILACAKHFAAYGAAEGGRDYNTVDISRQTLHDVYLPPFAAAVRAGVGSLMTSFNEINGVPSTGNRDLLTRILRDQWGFAGFIVTDWTSTTEMVDHGFADDDADAAIKAIAAGVDMDMCSLSFRTHLGQAAESGRVPLASIDDAVRRVLTAKFRLGLFDRPYVDPKREQELTLCAAHRDAARDVARHAIVLLKNEAALLPLGEKVQSLAVIGPLADSRRDPLGTWAGFGRSEDVVSALAGIRDRAGESVTVEYAPGCDVDSADTSGIAAAADLARKCDAAILVVGESENMSGEAHCRSSLDLPGVQRQLVQAVHATGTPTIVVLVTGRPLSIPWTAEHVPAILVAWHAGVESGRALADVLFGDFNPSGKLPATFPRGVGQTPIYYAHKNTGRPPTKDRFTSKYIDLPSTPLYPFGYGLSYTTFGYDRLELSAARLTADATLEVRADVTNTGTRGGDEIVQLYVRDLVGSLTRPVKQLRGFQRVRLEPGKTQTVTFALTADHLGFHDADMRYVVEPGKFQLWVGPNSAEGLEAEFEIIDR